MLAKPSAVRPEDLMNDDCPALSSEFLDHPTALRLAPIREMTHPPRFLLLYGSLRERSYSRLLVEEADRLLRGMGAETRIYHPRGLPQPDDAPASHPKVAELQALSLWSEGHVWCSPERHGAMTGIFKSQIDWLPLEGGGCSPDPGSDPGRLPGQCRLAILQHSQSASHPGPLDADDHDPEPVVRGQGLR